MDMSVVASWRGGQVPKEKVGANQIVYGVSGTTNNLNVSLTGVSGTGSIGSFTFPASTNLTGISGIGSVGTFSETASGSVNLSGISGIGKIGFFVGLNPALFGRHNSGGFLVNVGRLMNR